MQELQVEFDKFDVNGAEKARAVRFLRSQQELRHEFAEIDPTNAITSSSDMNDVNRERTSFECVHDSFAFGLFFF
jgi:hypothetical protein